jgi:two-component system heavy metal sensor histidine kinase CusS
MLFLSRAEANAIPLALKPTAPEAMLRNFEQDAIVLAEHRRRNFMLTTHGNGEVHCEERWLRQVWLNLLTNALVATPEGGTVSMMSDHADGQWRVTIDDEGPGLAESELDRIFDRFTQFGSPERRALGSGLGLAISRSIVLLHQGTIRAENRQGRSGLRVIVTLPADQTSSSQASSSQGARAKSEA